MRFEGAGLEKKTKVVLVAKNFQEQESVQLCREYVAFYCGDSTVDSFTPPEFLTHV